LLSLLKTQQLSDFKKRIFVKSVRHLADRIIPSNYEDKLAQILNETNCSASVKQ